MPAILPGRSFAIPPDSRAQGLRDRAVLAAGFAIDSRSRNQHRSPHQGIPLMPEEIEIDTDKLRETIDTEIEKEGGRLLRGIALTTAVLAALAAIASLQAGATVNEALVLKTEATRLQAEASDQWAFYQAKGIKAAVATAGAEQWRALGKSVPAELTQRAEKETLDQQGIRKMAEEKERERDARSGEADVLLERHHKFANAVALFQIAIALGAVAALTRLRLVWIGSILLGLAGLTISVPQWTH